MEIRLMQKDQKVWGELCGLRVNEAQEDQGKDQAQRLERGRARVSVGSGGEGFPITEIWVEPWKGGHAEMR